MQIACPRCGRKYSVSAQIAGTQVQCTHSDCGHVFRAAEPAADAPRAGERVTAPPPPLPPRETNRAGGLPVRQRADAARAKPGDVAQPGPGPVGGAAGTIDRVVEALTKAISVQKLGFLLVGALCVALVVGLMTGLIGALAMGLDSPWPLILLIVPVLTAIGSIGVLSGGVARLMYIERQHGSARWSDAVNFCRTRFFSLFLGTLAVLFAIFTATALVNGLSAVLHDGGTAGSWISAALFVPQVAFNLVLAVALPAGVIVPCAVAVEGTSAVGAIRRFIRCLVRKPGSVLTHFAVSVSLGVMALAALGPLLGLAFGFTLTTNGPDNPHIFEGPAAFIANSIDAGSASASSTSEAGHDQPEFWTQLTKEPGGQDAFSGIGTRNDHISKRGTRSDWLRYIGILIVLCIPTAYFIVYWICSFTGYYEHIVPQLGIEQPNPQ